MYDKRNTDWSLDCFVSKVQLLMWLSILILRKLYFIQLDKQIKIFKDGCPQLHLRTINKNSTRCSTNYQNVFRRWCVKTYLFILSYYLLLFIFIYIITILMRISNDKKPLGFVRNPSV